MKKKYSFNNINNSTNNSIKNNNLIEVEKIYERGNIYKGQAKNLYRNGREVLKLLKIKNVRR